MSRNVEIKAKLLNRGRAVDICNELTGGKWVELVQKDFFFQVPHGRLKLRCELDKSELLFYKRPDQLGPKLCEYLKYPTKDSETLHEILKNCLPSRGVVSKHRLLYLVGQTRVHIDSVDNLGDFLELEVVLEDEQTTENGTEIANHLMEKLGVKQEDLIENAYIDLLTGTQA